MKRSVVQSALLAAGILLPAMAGAAPIERVAVIRIMSIDGIMADAAPVRETRDQAFLSGSSLRVSKSAVGSLEGVTALVLIDRRLDSMTGGELLKHHSEEVISVTGDTFTVKGVDGRDVTYALDSLSDGSVDVLGPADRIIAREKGAYKVWKLEGVSLMPKDRITLY